MARRGHHRPSAKPGELVAELTRRTTAATRCRARFWKARSLCWPCTDAAARAKALAAYQRAAKTPSPMNSASTPGRTLGLLHKHILAAEPGLLEPSPLPGSGAAGSRQVTRRNGPDAVVPRQLPAPALHLVGRAPQLAALDALAVSARAGPGALVIGVIHGNRGRQNHAGGALGAPCGRPPTASSMSSLRGFERSERAVDSDEAIRGFLNAFHCPAEQLPGSTEAQAALYRSLVASRRMLMGLDSAPGTLGTSARAAARLAGLPLVLVTSRNAITGTVLPKARSQSPLTCSARGKQESCCPAASARSGCRSTRVRPANWRLCAHGCRLPSPSPPPGRSHPPASLPRRARSARCEITGDDSTSWRPATRPSASVPVLPAVLPEAVRSGRADGPASRPASQARHQRACSRQPRWGPGRGCRSRRWPN